MSVYLLRNRQAEIRCPAFPLSTGWKCPPPDFSHPEASDSCCSQLWLPAVFSQIWEASLENQGHNNVPDTIPETGTLRFRPAFQTESCCRSGCPLLWGQATASAARPCVPARCSDIHHSRSPQRSTSPAPAVPCDSASYRTGASGRTFAPVPWHRLHNSTSDRPDPETRSVPERLCGMLRRSFFFSDPFE